MSTKRNISNKQFLKLRRNYLSTNGSILSTDLKYINTISSNYPVHRFSMPDRAPNNYAKPNKLGMYTLEEINRYKLTYNFVGIYITSSNGVDSLVSYAELYVKPSFVEIYNVYTHSDYRRKGYASKILQLIKTLHPTKDLWLGVKKDDKAAMTKIEMYAKSGFTSEVKVTNVTPSGKTMPFEFIEMKYKHGKAQTSENAKQKTLNKAQSFLNSYSKLNGGKHVLYKARFHITPEYLRKATSLVFNNKTKEHAGVIQFTYSGFKNGLFTFKSEKEMSKTQPGYGGEKTTNFGVNAIPQDIDNKYLITWHTHPQICYVLGKTCAGLPSGNDIVYFLQSYLNGSEKTGVNLIFAVEGVYVIRLKSQFVRHVEKQKVISKDVFTSNEFVEFGKWLTNLQIAQFTSSPSKSNIVISQYKKFLEDVKIPGTNIHIFNMELKPYSTSGIDIDTTLHPSIIYKTKSFNKPVTKPTISVRKPIIYKFPGSKIKRRISSTSQVSSLPNYQSPMNISPNYQNKMKKSPPGLRLPPKNTPGIPIQPTSPFRTSSRRTA